MQQRRRHRLTAFLVAWANECADWDSNGFFATATVKDVAECLQAGVDLAARETFGRTPLHIAAMRNERPLVVTALVGVNLNGRDTSDGTPLHVAASTSDAPAVVKALIDAGANLEARDQKGRTPLHRAYDRFYRSAEVIDVLRDAGADVQARDSRGKTPAELGNW